MCCSNGETSSPLARIMVTNWNKVKVSIVCKLLNDWKLHGEKFLKRRVLWETNQPLPLVITITASRENAANCQLTEERRGRERTGFTLTLSPFSQIFSTILCLRKLVVTFGLGTSQLIYIKYFKQNGNFEYKQNLSILDKL